MVAGAHVSVLMPVYNAGPYLAPAIESILAQTYRDFEFVAIDDGSTDGSADILRHYASTDGRIRAFTNEHNSGIVTTLNRGIQECRGEYIVRMDADDIAVANRIEKQLAVISRDASICLVGAGLTYIDAAGRDLGIARRSSIPSSWLRQNTILHPTVILRRDVLARHGLCYRERYRYAEDYYLWMELSRTGRIAVMEDLVLQYRLSSGATRVRQMKGVIRATLRAKRDAISRLGIRPTPADLAILALQGILLLLPARPVLWMYLRMGLGLRRPATL